MHQEAQPKVVVEHEARGNNCKPLWQKCENRDDGRALSIEQLIDHVKVNAVVVSVVFSYKVVKVSFIQKFVPIDKVEESC